jgi:hypothetical protein
MTEASTANQKYWTERCLRAGYNQNVTGATGPDMVTLCRTKAADLLSNANNAVKVTSSMNMGNSLVGAGIAAGEWMPHMQAMLCLPFLWRSCHFS